MQDSITRLDAGRHLAIHWSDNTVTEFPWLWLRDHAHDPATLHPVTQQRQLHSASIDPDISATAVATVDGDVVIQWPSGETSSLPVQFLARFKSSTGAITPGHAAVLWDATTVADLPNRVEFSDILDSDDGLQRWLAATAMYGFAIATNTPPTAEATEQLLRRIGYIRETIFGGFWEFTADLSKADTAYTNLELLPHTDGTYSHDAPGLQLLHCLFFDGQGGESTMVDGFAIAEHIRQTRPDIHHLLSTVPIPGQYIGDGSHLMSARPVLRHDSNGALAQVSYNNADRAPFLLEANAMIDLFTALRTFDQLTNQRNRQWRHVLRPGEAMLFDNWRVLHGRTAYTGKRQLCGAYVNHEDFESRLRVLNA